MAKKEVKKYEVTLNGVHYELENKKLSDNLNNFAKGLAIAKAGAWSVSKALYNISHNQYYKPEFESFKAFLDYFRINKVSASQYVHATECMINYLMPAGYNEEVTTTNAYEVSRLGDKINDFLKWFHDKGLNLVDISQKDLIKEKKEYLGIIDVKQEEPQQEEPKQEETETEIEDAIYLKALLDGDNVVLFKDDIKYIIPLDELKHYKA